MSRVIHFEIHADDPERAVRFYGSVFGWQMKKWQGPEDYWLITTGDGPGINGGLMRRRGPGPAQGQPVNAYVCTIGSTRLEEDVRKVEASGGKTVVPKMAIPGVGWLVYVVDTEGNIFGLMQEDAQAK